MKRLLYIIALIITITACSDTDGFFSVFHSKAGKTQVSPFLSLKKAMKYIKDNEQELRFLQSRDLSPSDLKYGLARKSYYKGQLLIEIPVVKGMITTGNPLDNLDGRSLRTSVCVLFDKYGDIQTIECIERLPTKEYFDKHGNSLFYDDFYGEMLIYDKSDNIIADVDFGKAITRLSTDDEVADTDTAIMLPEVVVPGHKPDNSSPITPDDSDLGNSDDNVNDSDMSTPACSYCNYSPLPLSPETNDYYCPNCGHDYSGSTGSISSGSRGGGSGSSSYYKIHTATSYLTSHAHPAYNPKTCGHCARAVRLALEQMGINTSDHPLYAKNYGPYLLKWGFSEIPKTGYTAKEGDIRVFQNYPGGSQAGHIDMYNGKNWVSDFIEHNPFPNSEYKSSSYKIYRK